SGPCGAVLDPEPLPREHRGLLRRETGLHPGRRPYAAGQLADPVRFQHGQLEPASALRRTDDAHRRGWRQAERRPSPGVQEQVGTDEQHAVEHPGSVRHRNGQLRRLDRPPARTGLIPELRKHTMKLKNLVIGVAMLGSLATAPVFAQSELTSAVMNGQADIVDTLISRDIDVNMVERDGTTPLQWAVYGENVDIVKKLIEAGADVTQTNREGMTPLALAATTGNVEIVRLLLDAGAPVDQTLRNGETPLMMAARTGNLETIQLILDRGADINAREN